MQLAEHPTIETIFIGGRIQRNAMVTTGIDVIQFLSNISANICFIGVSGFSLEQGITGEGYEVALVKKAMIKASQRNVYLSTSNKLNIRLNYDVCNFKEIDIAITDLDLQDPLLKPYIDAGVTLI
jgi:DeoR/GlpR family transcriptional regulator of sugar metabolism